MRRLLHIYVSYSQSYLYMRCFFVEHVNLLLNRKINIAIRIFYVTMCMSSEIYTERKAGKRSTSISII